MNLETFELRLDLVSRQNSPYMSWRGSRKVEDWEGSAEQQEEDIRFRKYENDNSRSVFNVIGDGIFFDSVYRDLEEKMREIMVGKSKKVLKIVEEEGLASHRSGSDY